MSGNRVVVVLVTDTLAYGGSERLLVDIATRLDRKAFDVKVCATTAGGELLEAELAKAGVEYRILNKSLGWNVSVLPKLRSLFRQWRPQIVHTFRFTANTYGRIGAILARVPVIISTEHVLEHKTWVYRLVDWVLARFTDRVVVVTKEIGQQVHADAKLPHKRIELIEEGIDLKRFARVDRNPPLGDRAPAKDPFMVGIVARLYPQKGHMLFLDAIRRAHDIRPAIKGIIVGEGPLRPELQQSVADRGMQNVIEFWGFREDLPQVFQDLDLFVMSSGWEGLPLALLDAAATGLPFVCAAVGGIPDVFQDRIHGRLVTPGNPQELADAIVWSFDNYATGCSLAATASDLVHLRHGMDAMIQRHEGMYRELVQP